MERVRLLAESLRKSARDPMKSWDSGRCVDAQGVEDRAEELLDVVFGGRFCYCSQTDPCDDWKRGERCGGEYGRRAPSPEEGERT
jgi:hypothetical protein